MSTELYKFAGGLASEHCSFAVWYQDYPDLYLAQTGTDKLLDNTRDAMAQAVRGTVAKEDKITFLNYPGRNIAITAYSSEAEKMTMHLRIFLVNNRLYRIMVIDGELQRVPQDVLNRFMASFQLTKPAG